ncbi:alpha/beta hydrolase [Rubritalea tangerina]|uniref:Alpha/beta hydrolase n=1 Tax=Rubritalea tangerina TaxID=430798 RepID=A0ABW4Z9T1_9BACT
MEARDAAERVRPDKLIEYKKIQEGDPLKLHVFQPSQVKGEVPCMVFFFGGGWAVGSPVQFYQQADEFRKRGLVTICAEYRVAKKHKVRPDACVEDAKSAIRWVRKHAGQLGIDGNKVIAAGGSAGGHLAACTAFVRGFEAEGEDLAISSKPNYLVLYNPVLDTTELGYGVEKVKELRQKLSPVHQVVEGGPPTIVMHGKADETVPFENAERFSKVMKEKGNSCTLVPYVGAAHGFFNSPMFRKKANLEYYKSTIEETAEFLDREGLLKP